MEPAVRGKAAKMLLTELPSTNGGRWRGRLGKGILSARNKGNEERLSMARMSASKCVQESRFISHRRPSQGALHSKQGGGPE